MNLARFLSIPFASVLLASFVSVAIASDDSIEKIKSSGTLRACFADDNPWEVKDPASGQWQGVLPDMAADIATSLNVNLVQVDATWATLIQNLEADKCDIIAASLFATVKRAESIIFTNPYAYEYATVYVPKDSAFKAYDQLDAPGKVIAVRAGTAEADSGARFFKNATIKPYLGDSSLAILTDLSAKRIDGWLDSVVSTGRFLEQNPQYPVRPIGDAPLMPAQVVWGVKSGDYRFQQLLNTAIFGYLSSGKMATSWTKWFGTKYEPPKL
jgi:ABC-type amino acid transport substrate-binding protein